MSKYSFIERKLASMASAFPGLKQMLKRHYQNLNFIIYGEKGFEYSIHPDATITSPLVWAGIKKSEVFEQEYFGYYDKTPWSQDMEKYLVHQINTENKSLTLVVYDKGKNCYRKLDESSSWSKQQATMAQWLMRDDRLAVIFNSVVDGKLGAKIVSDDKLMVFHPWPIQVMRPGDAEYLSVNYNRIHELCPEYGYSKSIGKLDINPSDSSDGIFLVNVLSGSANLIVSYYDVQRKYPLEINKDKKFEINHCLFSPSGSKFVFMQRWISKQGRRSRLFVYCMKNSSFHILLDEGMVSHYSWVSDRELVMWARTRAGGDAYYLINVDSCSRVILGKDQLDKFGDGHPSYSPCGNWLITDTYPDRALQQRLILFNMKSSTLIEVGRFLQPRKFRGAERCDLHPRWSRDGKLVSIDSTHSGFRKNYILDVSKLIESSCL